MPERKLSSDMRKRVFDEISKNLRTPPGPDEVTTRMVAKEHGIDTKTARRELNKLVEKGVMTVREGLTEDGFKCNVYGWKDEQDAKA